MHFDESYTDVEFVKEPPPRRPRVPATGLAMVVL